MRIRKYAHKHFPRYNGGNLQYLGFRSITSVFMDESQPVSAMSSSIMSTTYVVETSYCKRHLNCKLPVHSTSRISVLRSKAILLQVGLAIHVRYPILFMAPNPDSDRVLGPHDGMISYVPIEPSHRQLTR